MEIIQKYSLLYAGLFVFFMFYNPIYCFLILGFVIFYYGISCFIFLNYISKHGIETVGKILSYEADSDGYKTPIIEFKAMDGTLYSKKPIIYASTDLSIFKTYSKDLNKIVPILYSEKNPEKFVMKTEKGFNYGTLTLMLLISIIFLIISIGQIFGFFKIVK